MDFNNFNIDSLLNGASKYFGFDRVEKLVSRLDDLPVKVIADTCVRLRYSGDQACNRCIDICPVEAITFAPGIKIDYDKCVDCGLCCTLCPVSALESRLSEDFLLAKVKKAAEDSSSVIFRCAKNPAKAGAGEKTGLILPCLGRITETLLVGAAVYGAKSVVLDKSACADCPSNAAVAVMEKQVVIARELLSAFGREVDFTADSDTPSNSAIGSDSEDDIGLYSRRDIFVSLQRQMIVGGAEILGRRMDSFSNSHKEEPLFTYRLPRRRELLLLLLKKMGEPGASTIDSGKIPVAALKISDSCTFCENCILFCPTNALRKSTNGESGSIDFTLSGCTDCGLCVDICAPKAISAADRAEAKLLTQSEPVPLIECGIYTCSVCAQKFSSAKPAKECHFCRLRESRMALELTVENDEVVNES